MTTTTENRHALPTGYQLQDYRLISIIGHGGFGITYLAKDTKLNHEVAIKEYFPNDLAIRENDHNVHPKSHQDKENFAWGLERFLQEGQTLATFQHPNIVRVLRYFEAHNTAYIVMEYEQGQSLSSAIKNKGTATEAFLLEIVSPLLEGLQAVHEAGLLHRDIKPDNIYLRDKDHSPVLLDFGAARYAIGSRSRSVTTIVTPGYTPFEQYQTKGDQGPWTDIYALGAVLYRIISDKIPVEAPKRVNAIKLREEADPLPPATKIGRKHYSERLLRNIDWALEIAEKDRPQTVSQWAEALLPPPSPTEQAKQAKPVNRPIWPIYLVGAIAITLTLGYVIYTSQRLAQLHQQQQSLQQRVKEVHRQLEEANKAKDDDQQQLAELLLKQATLQQALSKIQRQVYLASKARQADQAALQQALSKVQRQLEDVDAKIYGTIFHDYLQDKSLGPEMVWIPAGRFKMGDIQGQGDNDEQPVHWVSVEKFAMGRSEVTFAEYDRFAEASGREKPNDNGWGRGNRPVINVSMADATAYATWLSQQTQKQYQLPTEAQWEYAARAGTETLYWWGNEIGSNRANCDGCGSQWDNNKTAPAGSFAPNPFGLYDTVGNVWEWACSEYQEKYNGKEQACATIPNNNTTLRVERGGSLYNYPKALRAANRYKKSFDYRNASVGFRLCRTQ